MIMQSLQMKSAVAVVAAGTLTMSAAAGVTLDSASVTLGLTTGMSTTFFETAFDSDTLGPTSVSGPFALEANNDLTFEPSIPNFPEFYDLSVVQSGFVDNTGAVIDSGFVLNDSTASFPNFLDWAQDVQTTFSARWTVTEPTPFSIEINTPFLPIGIGIFNLFSFGPVGGPSIISVDVFDFGPPTASAEGVLMPGEYFLAMQLEWQSEGDVSSNPVLNTRDIWSVNLQIPSPGAASVLALAGVAALRRRR